MGKRVIFIRLGLKFILSITLIGCLVGCVGQSATQRFSNIETLLNGWHGSSQDILFKYWGAPDNTVESGSQSVYTYINNTSVNSISKQVELGSKENSTKYVQKSTPLSCKISFTVNSDKKIVDHLVDGQLGACESVVKPNPYSAAQIKGEIKPELLSPLNKDVEPPSGRWKLVGFACLDGAASLAGKPAMQQVNQQVQSGLVQYYIDLDKKIAEYSTQGCVQNNELSLEVINNRYKMTVVGGTGEGCPILKGASRILERRGDKLYDYNPGSEALCETGYSVQELDLLKTPD